MTLTDRDLVVIEDSIAAGDALTAKLARRMLNSLRAARTDARLLADELTTVRHPYRKAGTLFEWCDQVVPDGTVCCGAAGDPVHRTVAVVLGTAE